MSKVKKPLGESEWIFVLMPGNVLFQIRILHHHFVHHGHGVEGHPQQHSRGRKEGLDHVATAALQFVYLEAAPESANDSPDAHYHDEDGHDVHAMFAE